MDSPNATPPSPSPDPYVDNRDYGRELPSAPVLKALESVCACVGSSVIFHCTFHVPEFFYSYVVWTVGHHIVERSNCRFSVMHKAGDHLLYIPRYMLSMSGEVSCELRYSLPQRRSVLINKTIAQLSAVPRLNARQLPQLPPMDRRRRRQENPSGAHSAGPQNQTMAHDLYIMTPMSTIGMPFYITYCRFADGNNYLYVTINDMVITRHVTVLVMADGFGFSNAVECDVEAHSNIVFQWDRFIYPVSIQSQYGVEIMDDYNRYVQLGITSIPAVEVAGLRFEKIIKLRVRLLGAFFGMIPDSNIRVHLCEASQSPTRYISMGNWDIFQQLYSAADDVIGSGSFGQGSLVGKNASHVIKYYAAKLLTLRNSRKNSGARMEYEIMASLSHLRVVQLVDAFMGCNCMTIVMEYLSGLVPFDGVTWVERASNIQLANYSYDDDVFTEISSQVRDFIDALLLVKPRSCMTASEALQHPWLDEVNTSAMRVPMKRAQSNLKKYLATRARWQRAHNIIKAALRFRILGGLSQIQEEGGAEVSQS